jgi:hypothetical protein
MAKATQGFIGLTEFGMAIKDLPKELQKDRAMINKGARNAVRPAISAMKSKIVQDARNHYSGKMGFSKLLFLARVIKTYTNKSKHNFGVHVRFADNLKMRMSKKKRWSVQAVGKLFAEGAYMTSGRKGRGPFHGFGNWAQEAKAMFAATMRRRFTISIHQAVNKAANRVTKRR